MEKNEKATVARAASSGIPLTSCVRPHWLANRQKHTNHRKVHTPRVHTGTHMHKHAHRYTVFLTAWAIKRRADLKTGMKSQFLKYKNNLSKENRLSTGDLLKWPQAISHTITFVSLRNGWLWTAWWITAECLIQLKSVRSSSSTLLTHHHLLSATMNKTVC